MGSELQSIAPREYSFFLGLVSPGPNFLVVIESTLRGGQRSRICTGLGASTGDGIHALIGILGFSTLSSQGEWLFQALKLVGAGYLTFLGIRMCLRRRAISDGVKQCWVPGIWQFPHRAVSECLFTNFLAIETSSRRGLSARGQKSWSNIDMKKMRSRSMACAEQPIGSDETSPCRGAARTRVSTFVAPSQSFRTTIFAADASADKSRPQPAKTDANTAVSILHPEWIKATRLLWTIFCSCNRAARGSGGGTFGYIVGCAKVDPYRLHDFVICRAHRC
jgi:LysE type translocator